MISIKQVVLTAQVIVLLLQMCYMSNAEIVITAPNIESVSSFDKTMDTSALSGLSEHPCKRECKDDEPPMECHYEFNLEAYHTMSKACFNCPSNVTDCFRPDCITADGVKRPLLVVNRKLPGPSIEVCMGDRVIVDVNNMLLSDSTTMHWHGQHHRATPYMDGVPYVTQCPIPPGSKFRYHYTAATSGTHFWHSHSGLQRGDGVFGALIVRVPEKSNPLHKLYDFDDHTMIVMDWDHATGTDKFLAHHHADGDNKPPNILINGLGRYNETKTPIATFVVKESYRYRFRLINAEFLNCPIEVSIDNHTLYVVSTDGNDIEPVEAESIVTYAGERFDFIVGMDQEIDNYWIRFRGLMDCDERFTKANQVAILRYEGAPEVEPIAAISYERVPTLGPNVLQVNALNQGTETNSTISMPLLESLDPDDEANTREPDHQFYVSYDFYDKDNPHFHRKDLYGFKNVIHKAQKLYTPQLNYISMKLPDFPLLSQRESIEPGQFCNESSVAGCEDDFCACTHVLQVELGSVVELILVDKGYTYDANHPFHLHGHDFRVVAMERVGKNVTVEEVKKLDADGLINRKLSRAPIKDTVTVPDGGYTVVRFHANNPGYWIFHCHIEFHVELGMALIFKVGEHDQFPPVPEDFPRCGNYLPSGRPEVVGKSTTTTTTTTTPRTSTSSSTSTTTTTTTTTTTPDPRENEVEREKMTITQWLPLIIREIRKEEGLADSSSSSIYGRSQNVAIAIAFILILNIFR